MADVRLTCHPEVVLSYLRGHEAHAKSRADWSESFASSNEDAASDAAWWRQEHSKLIAMANTVESMMTTAGHRA